MNSKLKDIIHAALKEKAENALVDAIRDALDDMDINVDDAAENCVRENTRAIKQAAESSLEAVIDDVYQSFDLDEVVSDSFDTDQINEALGTAVSARLNSSYSPLVDLEAVAKTVVRDNEEMLKESVTREAEAVIKGVMQQMLLESDE